MYFKRAQELPAYVPFFIDDDMVNEPGHKAGAKRKTTFSLAVILAMLVVANGCAGEPKHRTWSNATGGEAHEKLMWQAIHEKQWDEVSRHLAPTFVGSGRGGELLDRAGWVEHWKEAPLGEFSLGEIATQPEGADMVVSSVLQVPGESANPGFSGGYRVVSVWQDIKGRWTLIASSITPIAPMRK